MTVAELKKKLMKMPKDSVVILAIEVKEGPDDSYAVEEYAVNVTLRPDNRVQIGDQDN